MTFELIIFAVAITLMLVTILTKYLTTVRLVRSRERLHQTEVELNELKGKFKTAQNEKSIAESNEKSLNAKKTRFEKRIPRLREELKSLEN